MVEVLILVVLFMVVFSMYQVEQEFQQKLKYGDHGIQDKVFMVLVGVVEVLMKNS